MRVHASERIARAVRVFLDGQEITADCEEASEEGGWARVSLRNERGRHYLVHEPIEPGDFAGGRRADLPIYPARRILRGRVEIRPLPLHELIRNLLVGAWYRFLVEQSLRWHTAIVGEW